MSSAFVLAFRPRVCRDRAPTSAIRQMYACALILCKTQHSSAENYPSSQRSPGDAGPATCLGCKATSGAGAAPLRYLEPVVGRDVNQAR